MGKPDVERYRRAPAPNPAAIVRRRHLSWDGSWAGGGRQTVACRGEAYRSSDMRRCAFAEPDWEPTFFSFAMLHLYSRSRAGSATSMAPCAKNVSNDSEFDQATSMAFPTSMLCRLDSVGMPAAARDPGILTEATQISVIRRSMIWGQLSGASTALWSQMHPHSTHLASGTGLLHADRHFEPG